MSSVDGSFFFAAQPPETKSRRPIISGGGDAVPRRCECWMAMLV